MSTSDVGTITLTAEQLAAIVENAVSKALEAKKASRKPSKPEDPAKAERAAKYMAAKQETATELARKNGRHYYVCKKGRKLLIWSGESREAARRKGLDPDVTMGKPVWSTYEGGFRLYMAN